jgi:hypothetical protein
MRIVPLIANGVWLPFFVFGNASRMYLLATTTPKYFATNWLVAAIPTVVGSLILAGNVVYIWRARPHAAFRIVLLIANGVWLPLFAVGSAAQVYVLAMHDHAVTVAIATHVVCFLILVGNIAYTWRSRRHAHNEKGASASHTRQALG